MSKCYHFETMKSVRFTPKHKNQCYCCRISDPCLQNRRSTVQDLKPISTRNDIQTKVNQATSTGYLAEITEGMSGFRNKLIFCLIFQHILASRISLSHTLTSSKHSMTNQRIDYETCKSAGNVRYTSDATQTDAIDLLSLFDGTILESSLANREAKELKTISDLRKFRAENTNECVDILNRYQFSRDTVDAANAPYGTLITPPEHIGMINPELIKKKLRKKKVSFPPVPSNSLALRYQRKF